MLEKEKNSRTAIDFSRIYAIVSDLYCHDNGRPSVDPVVLFTFLKTDSTRDVR